MRRSLLQRAPQQCMPLASKPLSLPRASCDKENNGGLQVKQPLIASSKPRTIADRATNEGTIDDLLQEDGIQCASTGSAALSSRDKVQSTAENVVPHMQKANNENCPIEYEVLFTKRSNKKRKTYDDGRLMVDMVVAKLDLFDERKTRIATGRLSHQAITSGNEIELGPFIVQIGNLVSHVSPQSLHQVPKRDSDSKQTDAFNPKKSHGANQISRRLTLSRSSLLAVENAKSNAVVLDEKRGIFLDGFLAKIMRPHQIEGVKFMLKCIVGESSSATDGKRFYGCILADEMGLGKTIQAIGLIWTCQRSARPSLSRKCVIVCPASLVGNWKREFQKFLGPARLIPICVEDTTKSSKQVDLFLHGFTQNVLVISYETFRKHSEALNASTAVDLLICDEGHRLKSGEGANKTVAALDACPALKRIILTGTPLQNQLDEFFALGNFVCPGLLEESRSAFRRRFQAAIEAGRESSASEIQRKESDLRMEELANIAKSFLLRRTFDVNAASLPEKMESTVFLRPSERQIMLYERALEKFANEEENGDNQALRIIGTLKNICSLPGGSSVKLEFVQHLIDGAVLAGEKLVLVSNYTSYLDAFETMLRAKRIHFCRLDGSTRVQDRQAIVQRFNNELSAEKVFLLSSKAGGCGLNLIGASRLCLFDMDWNPAVDDQAMARIWRPGQKRPCFIYRLICTGTIEEKIFQRQIFKRNNSSGIFVDDLGDLASFNKEELVKLFELNFPESTCQTYEELRPLGWSAFEGSRSLEKDRLIQDTFEMMTSSISYVHSESSLDEKPTKSLVEELAVHPEEMETALQTVIDEEEYGEEEEDDSSSSNDRDVTEADWDNRSEAAMMNEEPELSDLDIGAVTKKKRHRLIIPDNDSDAEAI